MKKVPSFKKKEIAWATHAAIYAPGLLARVRAALPAGMPDSGLAHVLEAFEGPSRASRSTTRSSAGKFPSRKMGVTLGFESANIELPTAVTLEQSAGVVAFLDQSPPVRMTYRSGGRTRSDHHRPDFVVIYSDRVVLLECKRLGAIREKNEKHPGFFVKDDDGRWRCPPGEEAAEKLGMEYVVWTDADFGQEMIGNLNYLNEFITPDRHSAIKPPDEIQAYLEARGRATIAAILEDLRGAICVDDVLSAIARNEVTFDLRSAPLKSPALCWLYRDPETMAAFAAIAGREAGLDVEVKGAATVQVRPGDEIMWHGNKWICLAIDGLNITLSSEGSLQKIGVKGFLLLVDTGEIVPVGRIEKDSRYEQASQRILSASPGHLAIATTRLQRIQAFLDGIQEPPKSRTLRRYLKAYRSAEIAFGGGFGLAGLLPNTDKCGNRTPRLLEPVLKLAGETIKEYFLNPAGRKDKAVFLLLKGKCEKLGFTPPSYSWFCKRTANLPKFETELARKGRKGAYPFEPRIWIEGQATADYAFQVAHVDHTPLDLAVLLGIDGLDATRVWLTVMLCAFSRRVLAFSLSYEPPSNRSVVLVVRECVRRHHRLPERIIFDGGKEFGSTWTETMAALYRVIIQRRLVSKPRSGSEGERFFGTTTTQVIDFLTGNTQLTKNVRSMSSEVNPFNLAVWTVDELKEVLKEYFYEVYDQSKHTSLLCSPRQSFDSSMKLSGERASRFIRFDELFLILTSASPKKGHAKVQPDGVKINYQYYSTPEMRAHIGKSVPVRFDQFDLSNAWAYVGKRWLKVVSRNASILTRFSQRDLEVVTSTWRAHRSKAESGALSEPMMIKFLERLANDDKDLLAQRIARAERALRSKDGYEGSNLGRGSNDEGTESVPIPEPRRQLKPAMAPLKVSKFHSVEML